MCKSIRTGSQPSQWFFISTILQHVYIEKLESPSLRIDKTHNMYSIFPLTFISSDVFIDLKNYWGWLDTPAPFKQAP